MALISGFFIRVKNLELRQMLLSATCTAIQYNLNILYRSVKASPKDYPIGFADMEASFNYIQLLEIIVCHDGENWLDVRHCCGSGFCVY